ncbi:protein dpy-191-like [Tropilaelaps mercedesae]|uniref:Protein dpy-191-like n=1 Tax=Tropilaelaps mercedesae TaxID=418985 RepID=A0A1V9XQJ9_9ACAR|nr:protein dpy-191-like [Tropilaelaps mercedesae]
MGRSRKPKIGFRAAAHDMKLIPRNPSEDSEKPTEVHSASTTSPYKIGLLIGLALLCGALNSLNGYSLFENDRYFSHLSNLEREMTFRTEMGLYYSYYKVIVNAPSFTEGLKALVRNNVTEYPLTINTLKRFNLYPEVVIGLAYRIFNHLAALLGIEAKSCWMIDRKELPSVESCSGLGDLATFYVVSVYLWNAATGIALVGLAYLITDDSHIWNILRAKLSDYKDFHTMLYTCAPEFNFLKIDYLESLWPTLLVPLAAALLLLGAKLMQRQQLPAEVLYNLYQCLAFVTMAFMIMRLKMFLTPHLCILTSLSASPRFVTNCSFRLAIAATLLAIIALPGWRKLEAAHLHQGEYSNPQLEELLTFIDDYAESTDSFAGPMPLMANILLSTGRPIVNHPHYEDSEIRAKTVNIYTLLSRKSLREVYGHLKKLSVRYIVISRSWCRGKMRTGCALVDIWDQLDPTNRYKTQVCDRLASGETEKLFDIVFHNDEYTMLALM